MLDQRKQRRPAKAALSFAVDAAPLMRAEATTWMYAADGPRLFEAGEEIPPHYVDSPAKVRA